MGNNGRILIIDDEVSPRESVRLVLKDKYIVSTASDGLEGLDFMMKSPVDLVVLDIMMPGMDGVTVIQKIKKRFPEIEVIMLTAYPGLETARSAMRLGAFDYITKPFDKDDVIKVVARGLEKKYMNESLKLEREKLLGRTVYLEEEITKARRNIIMSYEGTVKALILTIDAKDHYTFGHSEHVARLSLSIAEVLQLPDNVKQKIMHAALIHDIGKIGIEESILRKNGPLTEEEFAVIKRHPEIGSTIIQSVPFLEDAVPVILYHHERYDGSGYPEGIHGDQIPLTARIVMVADAVDAMMRDRPYRESFKLERVLNELRKNTGVQFDPVVVDVILEGKVSLE